MPRGPRVHGPSFGLDDIPVVSRCILVLSAVISLCCRLGFISLAAVYFWYPLFFREFHLWRPFTGAFLLNLSGNTAFFSLVTLFRVVRNTRSLEQGEFQGRTADLVWMLVLCTGAASVVAYCMTELFPLVAVSMAVMYYAARKTAGQQVSIWGITMTPMQSVWVTLGLAFLLYQPWLFMLAGVGIGHAYFFLEDVAPRIYGWRLTRTPRFLYGWMHPSLNANTPVGREMMQNYTRVRAFSGPGKKAQ